MSEQIKHECGIALIRLRKPLSYFMEKYKTPTYAISRLYLLMQKQHNRGQDGAGIATIKIDLEPGYRYIDRYRSVEAQPIEDIFRKVGKKVRKAREEHPEKFSDPAWAQRNVPYLGEVYLGHLRYGTHGTNDIDHCHPFIRRSNWRSRNLVVAGNFNMTNVDELFNRLIELGQSPKAKMDTVTVLEKIGHFLDEENQMLFDRYNSQGYSNIQISEKIEQELNIQRVLRRSCKDFDGGYAMAGVTGHGAAFVARDPSGIRPAYYFANDEVVVVASEKPAIKTAFNAEYDKILEIEPGHALIIDKDGNYQVQPFTTQLPKRSCSFERIYFSRGTDPSIYHERKKLGELVVPQILSKIQYDIENTVFAYIPNTAETAFRGMVAGVDHYLVKHRLSIIEEGRVRGEELEKILAFRPRVEGLVSKDVKLRTFIADDEHRDELVAHVYDTTYEVVNKGKDTLVVIDDSIVRGTTLEKSILQMLDRLEPKRIIIVSSAPQIRYPDCYGIDMSKMHEFVAFRAMLSLLKKRKMKSLLKDVYKKCKKAFEDGTIQHTNHVKELYAPFTYEEISDEVAAIIRQAHIRAEVEVIFQTVENLHIACPGHLGDWYFTGNYPTPGGNKVVNKALMNFVEGKEGRAY